MPGKEDKKQYFATVRQRLVEIKKGSATSTQSHAEGLLNRDPRDHRPEEQGAHSDAIAIHGQALGAATLRLIDRAIEKIDADVLHMKDPTTKSGDYGLCEGCEEPIAPKRLDSVPYAKHCRECQEKLEFASTASVVRKGYCSKPSSHARAS